MKRSTNSVEVKRQNRNRVFRYVNGQAETSMPEISAALDISGPTVLTIVNELKEEGVLKEAGELKSTGGRKAKAIAAVKDIKYAVGIDLTANHISITYTDLSEKALKHVRIRKSFEYTNEYLDALAVFTRRFIEENAIPEDKILGIGISMSCIIDKKEQLITYSNALDIYNVSCSEWKEHFKYPAVLLNDANCAAIAESAEHVNCGNMVYLMLSNTVGGAVLFENSNVIMTAGNELEAVDMYRGDNWRSAEFGHMVIHPGGRTCYCGKKGCLDAYCSALRLADLTEGKLEIFFEKLEEGNAEYEKIWDEYLDNLAIAVDNLRMCFDCEVVLGGYVGNLIGPYVPRLRQMVAEKNLFGHDGNYVRACDYRAEASALGAAIKLITLLKLYKIHIQNLVDIAYCTNKITSIIIIPTKICKALL